MSDERRRTAARLGSAAESYFDSKVHRLGADHETLALWCRSATRAFDVVTGAGHTANAIADTGVSSVIATDAVPEMVVTAIREHPVAGVIAGAERLPFMGDVFGVTTCHIAAHRFPDPEAFVAEVARALKPGGVFVSRDNVTPEDAAPAVFLSGVEVLYDPAHAEFHLVSRWHEWFTVAGLSVETIETAAIRLQFDPRTERTNVSPADRDELECWLYEAPEEAKELSDVEFDDDPVVSFANPKALVRARTE